ncbi:MAG: DUF5658 family protein [Planctomycetaceae bacterium]
MPKRRPQSKRRPASPPPRLFGPIRLPQETLWFVMVNVLDYFMTYIVLYYSHLEDSPLRQRLVESNPLAAYFIDRWGLEKGLLGFKLGLVAAICLMSQRIALRQPRTARWVLNMGTLVTTAVVLYSVSLRVRTLR